MVFPDASQFDQDRSPGLVRELHKSIASRPASYRNLPGLEYGDLVSLPTILSTQCDDGYIIGVPYGRHLKIYYEFDDFQPLRAEFTSLLNELGTLAVEHTECTLMVLQYRDFPNRHHVDPIIMGAEFDDPVSFSLMRCRDVREQQIPDAPDGVAVRPATEADGDLLSALEERVAGDDALAPPLPDAFFSAARAVLIAEADGAAVGYIRLVDTDRRGILAEEFLVDSDSDEHRIGAALLHAAFEHGRDDNRRGLTIRVRADALSSPLIKDHGFKHLDDGLNYVRLADPNEVQKRHEEKIVSHVKVGKIFGMFR